MWCLQRRLLTQIVRQVDLWKMLSFFFNQFENNLRKDKCITGMVECLRNGNWYSKPPLGYDKLKVGREHVLTVNEKRQDTA